MLGVDWVNAGRERERERKREREKDNHHQAERQYAVVVDMKGLQKLLRRRRRSEFGRKYQNTG